MANSEKIKLVSTSFVKMVLPILKENCTVDEETGARACVSRPALAKLIRKAHRKELPKSVVNNDRLLVTMIELAEASGQLVGFESRLGRNGGLFKSEEKKARKSRKAAAPTAEAPATPPASVEDTAPEATVEVAA